MGDNPGRLAGLPVRAPRHPGGPSHPIKYPAGDGAAVDKKTGAPGRGAAPVFLDGWVEEGLEGGGVGFAGPDPDSLFKVEDKDFTIANGPGIGSALNGFNHGL